MKESKEVELAKKIVLAYLEKTFDNNVHMEALSAIADIEENNRERLTEHFMVCKMIFTKALKDLGETE